MTRPKIYDLDATPKITLSATDANGVEVLPVSARLSIKRPTGAIFTVTQSSMTNETTRYAYYFTTASGIGFYPYETSVTDSSGHVATAHHGFHIVDRVEQ